MPNWTESVIRAEGVEADIREFLERVRGPDDPFDFNRIIPMPKLLRHTAKGCHTFGGQKYRSWYVINPDLKFGDDGYENNQRPFTSEEEAVLRDIGYPDWYEWSVANWGTKWNACHVAIDELPVEDGAVEVTFDTAWAAPVPIFRKLAKMFPKLAFEFAWTDEDEPSQTHSLKIHISEGRND